MIITFESVDEILKCDRLNASFFLQYFLVVLFIMLCKVVLTFGSVNEILKCDHDLIASFLAVLSCDAFFYGAQDGSTFKAFVLIIKPFMKTTLTELFGPLVIISQ